MVRTGNSDSNGPSSEQSVRCECHSKEEENTSKKARNKLILASLIALFFMIGELVGKEGRGGEGRGGEGRGGEGRGGEGTGRDGTGRDCLPPLVYPLLPFSP